MRPVAVLVLVAGVALPLPALACMNASRAETSRAVKLVKAAETALADGKLDVARKTIEKAKLNDYGYDRDVTVRAHRIHALAVSRSPKSNAAALAAAVEELQRAMDRSGELDPTQLADFAEVLSRTESGQEAALHSLRNLADKELLGSAYALAALARLERLAGDAGRAKIARDRCLVATKSATICQD